MPTATTASTTATTTSTTATTLSTAATTLLVCYYIVHVCVCMYGVYVYGVYVGASSVNDCSGFWYNLTRSVCVAIYYWFYSYVHTNLQTVSNCKHKPFLGIPHSVTIPTATTKITTVITSSSCIAPLCSPSSNTIFSPA